MIKKLTRKILPFKIRRFLLKLYWDWIFKKSIKKFRKLENYKNIEEKLIKDLIRGWGNQGYSSLYGYTKEFIECATKVNGTILDCGSGLSTILLGIMADKFDFTVVSLEESEIWAKRIYKYINQ